MTDDREAKIERDMPYKGWMTGRGHLSPWWRKAFIAICIISFIALAFRALASRHAHAAAWSGWTCPKDVNHPEKGSIPCDRVPLSRKAKR